MKLQNVLNIAVFFYPRKSKVPKKPFVSLFLLFFSRLKIFFSPTFTISYRAFWSFLTYFPIFSRVEFSFSRSEWRILRYFFIWRNTFLFFVLGFFFLFWNFAVFPLAHFASRPDFKALSRAVWNHLGQKISNILGRIFYTGL